MAFTKPLFTKNVITDIFTNGSVSSFSGFLPRLDPSLSGNFDADTRK